MIFEFDTEELVEAAQKGEVETRASQYEAHVEGETYEYCNQRKKSVRSEAGKASDHE